MSMIEVDLKLFIKCRLCLEDTGTYQIVPSVREQISYCFQINVEPFDGLPQLICKKCQVILCNYSTTKKSFIEKQTLLKVSQQNNLPQVKVVKLENVGPAVKRESTDSVDKSQSNNSKRRKISVSSNKSECSLESNNQVATKHSSLNLDNNNQEQSWTTEYQKSFGCKLCSIHFYTWKSAMCHKQRHKVLKSKHAEIFNKNCVVVLHKVDNQSNITGTFDKVVYSKHKIIAKGTPDFNITYNYTGKNGSNESDEENTKPNDDFNIDESSDSSFRSNHALVRRRRRRRICSRSSNETVVLENQSNATDGNESDGKSQTNECINIDDTDSDDEKIKVEREQRKVTKRNSISAIKATAVAKLITTTYNKYLKKHENPEKPAFNQLNRKITSIGRQIINKRGFNCTRVIKYMEHLNLDIIWLSRSPLNVTSNTNYFKIIARSRYSNEKNINNFAGYKTKYNKLTELSTTEKESSLQETGIQEFGEAEASDAVETSGVVEESGLVEEISKVNTSGNQDFYVEIDPMPSSNADERTAINYAPELNAAMLYSDTAVETRKLLNANPVANPRQLKKFTIDSKKDKAKPAMPTLEIDPNELSAEVTSGYENNIQMPIIKFTTSLAVPEATSPSAHNETLNNNSNSSPVISNSEKPQQTAPRIKVKSVTELMSKETLNRMNEASAPVVTQSQQLTQNGASFSVYGTPKVQNVTRIVNSVKNFHTPESRSEDYVILDTVELPNTKTSSPFKYFRMLLQVHNLTLLDTDFILTGDFHTLIRFKVLYKQETKDQPVILCLSLFCAKNVFCLKIKDRNEDNINMTKISANWQWEILKIYRGEVVTKLLNNAQKISQEVYDNTNSFLCLLKSINLVPK